MRREKEDDAVGRAARIDWRGAQDRRLLRAGLRLFRDQLEAHIDTEWGILARIERLPFSVRGATDRLIDFLLENEALDLIGLAQMKREEEAGKLREGRRRRARRDLARAVPPTDKPSEPSPDKTLAK